MKQDSHRAPQRCYRSGDETLWHRHARRLDGYRLYTSGDVRLPRGAAADRRPVRPGRRQLAKVEHELIELVRQRVYGIACGYADGNDAARLRQDPIHKLLLERDPLAGAALGSQPTLSRLD